uniref:CCHC-type domain-containing protein n=1 Tax=Salvator merianae TaxID=96440 RepID=A0A8D0EDI9_SALMN
LAVKAAVLQRYGVTPESYRQRFRNTLYSTQEGVYDLWARLYELACKWLQPDKRTSEEVVEEVVLERFVEALPKPLRFWVQEHIPRTGKQAVELAASFLTARQAEELREGGRDQTGSSCKTGDERRRTPLRVSTEFKGTEPDKIPRPFQEKMLDGKGMTNLSKQRKCFQCGKIGHIERFCPQGKTQASNLVFRKELELKSGMIPVRVNGKQVPALVDTGSFRSLIHSSLVRDVKREGIEELTSVFGVTKRIPLVTQALASCHRNRSVFEEISCEMLEHGYHRSMEDCQVKARKLRVAYNAAQTQNHTSGSAPANFPYLQLMETFMHASSSFAPGRVSQSLTIHPQHSAQTARSTLQAPGPSGTARGKGGYGGVCVAGEGEALAKNVNVRRRETPQAAGQKKGLIAVKPPGVILREILPVVRAGPFYPFDHAGYIEKHSEFHYSVPSMSTGKQLPLPRPGR